MQPLYLHFNLSPSHSRSMPGPPSSMAVLTRSLHPIGVQKSFCIGFHGLLPLSPRRVRNMRSAYDHPEVIDSYLAKEAGHNFHLATSSSLRLSPFGVTLKCSQPNKWHLIIDILLMTTLAQCTTPSNTALWSTRSTTSSSSWRS